MESHCEKNDNEEDRNDNLIHNLKSNTETINETRKDNQQIITTTHDISTERNSDQLDPNDDLFDDLDDLDMEDLTDIEYDDLMKV